MKCSVVLLILLTVLLSACGSNVSKQSDPTPTESMLSPTPSGDLLTPTPSESAPSPIPPEEALTPCEYNFTPPPLARRHVSETSTSIASQPKDQTREIFTQQEIYGVEVFHANWTKGQMDDLGLTKKVYESAGLTCYYNDSIAYSYLDFDLDSEGSLASTPLSIKVFGEDITGPREWRIGDTFEEVMALFPQEQDWESNQDGVFYGTYISETDEPKMPAGKITTDSGFKQIDIITSEGSFIRMDFPDDVLTQYEIYMYLAT
jgi:hypothetical protein